MCLFFSFGLFDFLSFLTSVHKSEFEEKNEKQNEYMKVGAPVVDQVVLYENNFPIIIITSIITVITIIIIIIIIIIYYYYNYYIIILFISCFIIK